MSAISIIARLTFREAIRRRIMLAGLVLGVAFVILFSIGTHFIFGDIAKDTAANMPSQMAADILIAESTNTFMMMGLYAATFLSIAMAALLGADTLAGEINSGTIQTIATKPIRRADVVLGKWLGFAELLGLYVLLLCGGIVLSTFIQSGQLPENLLIGLGLIYMESLLIMTITLMLSSAFPALATGGIVFGLYGLAFIGGWVEQFGGLLQNDTAIKVGIITSLVIPSESLWRRAAFEMQTPLTGTFGSPFTTTSVPSSLMMAYAFLYLIVILFLAVHIFQARDL
jgi:ABC-type transport system involved in multi-copper enzyme maturation, permease component